MLRDLFLATPCWKQCVCTSLPEPVLQARPFGRPGLPLPLPLIMQNGWPKYAVADYENAQKDTINLKTHIQNILQHFPRLQGGGGLHA